MPKREQLVPFKKKAGTKMKPRSTMMTPAEPSSDVTMKDLASSPRYPLLFVNPKTCDHCLQTTHDHEKDVDQQPRKPRYLWWMKTTRHSDGKIHPSGTICGICMEVKDRNYVKGTTNQMLAELRKDPTEDERFLRLRKKRAQGLPDDPSDRPNLKNTVKSTDTVSSAAKVGGYFYPLADFVRTRQLNNFKDMDELVKYINTTMGFKTGWGENKKIGVFVPNLPVGASYYFEDSITHTKAQEQSEAYGDVETARREFQDIVQNLDLANTPGQPSGAMDMESMEDQEVHYDDDNALSGTSIRFSLTPSTSASSNVRGAGSPRSSIGCKSSPIDDDSQMDWSVPGFSGEPEEDCQVVRFLRTSVFAFMRRMD